MKLIQGRKNIPGFREILTFLLTLTKLWKKVRLNPDQLYSPSYNKDCRTTLLPLLSSRLQCCEYGKGYSMAFEDKPENMHYLYIFIVNKAFFPP